MKAAVLLALIAIVGLCAADIITRTDAINSEMELFYMQGRRVAGSEKHTVHFAVKMRPNALDVCDTILNDIADPDSPRYGKHLTLAQVGKKLVDRRSTRMVEMWLGRNGVKYSTSIIGDFITVTAPIARLEALLSTEYYYFHSTIDNRIIKKAMSYSLPEEIARHVDFVSHTINYPPYRSRFVTTDRPEQSGSVSPQTIFSTYNIQTPTVSNAKANQSLFEALGQDFAPADLTSFQQQFNVAQNQVSLVIGPNDPTQCSSNPNNCGEANLDVQYIMAVAQNAPTVYWSIDPNSQDPFVDWAVALGTTAYPALVHSMSYGSIAKEDDSHDIARFNTEMCKAGLRGLTVVIASGDDGVANFLARSNQSACGFSPSFPATSPYVVAVGATQGPESGQPEVACTSNGGGIVTSGGGFSIYAARPNYQNAAVSAYLQNAPNLPPTSMYNSAGRAYPDVAVLGFNYNVVIGGSTYGESGTSASAPVFAGMVTLVNNARLNAGKGPLGFITPALYKLGEPAGIFNDITVGENNCCAGQIGSIICCQYGFNATTGWDPVTGLGSINFPNFLAALSAL